jgi:hypothetical protein
MFRALSGKHYKLTGTEQKMSLDGRKDACNRECQGFKYMGLQSKDDCFCGDRYEYFDDKNARKSRRGGESDKKGDWHNFEPNEQTGQYNEKDSNTMCGGPKTSTCGDSKGSPEGGCCAHGGQNGNTCDWSNAVFEVANITDKCADLYLFDKVLDTDSRYTTSKKDKRITLKDMCPKECGVTKCQK